MISIWDNYISSIFKQNSVGFSICWLKFEQIHPCLLLTPYSATVLISQGRQAIVGWLEIGRYGVKLGKTYQVELRERELKGPKLPGGRSQQYRRAVVKFVLGQMKPLERLSPAQGD